MDDRGNPWGPPPQQPQQPVQPVQPVPQPIPPAYYPPQPRPLPPAQGRPQPQPVKAPFQLDISFDTMELSSELGSLLEPEQHVSKGEIYFANRPTPARPVSPPPAAKKKKKKRRHSDAVVLAVMVGILTLSALFSWVGITSLRDIFAIGKHAGEPVNLILGESLKTEEVIDLLADKGLLQQRLVCKIYSKFSFWMRSQNLKDPSEAKQPVYLPGPYTVASNLSLEELLSKFKSQPKGAEITRITFPEGYTVRQVAERAEKNGVVSAELLEKTLRNANFNYPFLQELNTDRRFYPYEGYLFPARYEFYYNENPVSALTKFFDAFAARWTEDYAAKAEKLGMTLDQVITLASIIQREAANKEQMKDISGVLHNRLNKKNAYPMLECDSTRDYVTANIAVNGMDSSTAAYYYEAYNTYQCIGLPVGPICNPGIDAIEAALNPKKHDYYYFQHDKFKKIYLSKTQEEHDKVTIDLAARGINQ